MVVVLTAAAKGFSLGLSLIVAIGAQNAFILRQGLLRSHVFTLCLICALSDATLIAFGVAGFGTLVKQVPWLITTVTIGGAIFLICYGFIAFLRASNPEKMIVSTHSGGTLKGAILTCLALTFLNPHVYLDTVILLGGLSAQYEGINRVAYGSGAILGSFAWFFVLGYGARLLVPIFEKPAAWRILDILIGIIMWLIAVSLIVQLFE